MKQPKLGTPGCLFTLKVETLSFLNKNIFYFEYLEQFYTAQSTFPSPLDAVFDYHLLYRTTFTPLLHRTTSFLLGKEMPLSTFYSWDIEVQSNPNS